MINNFPNCLAVTLKQEGGYSNNPHDPGGATMRGVTQAVYNAYRRALGLPGQTVRLISDSELQDIYRRQYWEAIRGDLLPKGLDMAVFDMAVNSGVVPAIKILQKALGVPADGHFGLITQGALPKNGGEAAARFCKLRLSFLEQLREWKFFDVDWKRRVTTIAVAAQAMAR